MCGLVALWGSTDEEAARGMLARLVHRGPDAEGWHVDHERRYVLGHRRLSIMDPGGGDQPILSTAGDGVVVANGELYNFPELRRELEGDYRFRTQSDTEVLLPVRAEKGADAAAALDGMFACVVVDEDGLFAARDPLGIKPLYAGRRDGALVLASELGALAGYATDVKPVPPGTWYHSERGFRRYYEVPDPEPEDRPIEEHAKNVLEVLEGAVVKRLMSDVPLGAFLSGGLDSSLIAALARRHMDELHTFAVGVEGSADLLAARRVAEHIDSIHHEHVFTREEVVDRLPEIVTRLESYDQDLVRSAMPCWLVSKLAREHVKVVLTGEGADELFAGYAYYEDVEDPAELRAELRRSVTALHDVNLQRVDRMTMAHGLEARVPFLDVEMVETALRVPVEQKLPPRAGGERLEKLVLRLAAKDLLPDEIVWRGKEQFDEGSGASDLLEEALSRQADGADPRAYVERHPEARLRSPEEAAYHRILSEAWDDPTAVLSNVARWSEREEQEDLGTLASTRP